MSLLRRSSLFIRGFIGYLTSISTYNMYLLTFKFSKLLKDKVKLPVIEIFSTKVTFHWQIGTLRVGHGRLPFINLPVHQISTTHSPLIRRSIRHGLIVICGRNYGLRRVQIRFWIPITLYVIYQTIIIDYLVEKRYDFLQFLFWNYWVSLRLAGFLDRRSNSRWRRIEVQLWNANVLVFVGGLVDRLLKTFVAVMAEIFSLGEMAEVEVVIVVY